MNPRDSVTSELRRRAAEHLAAYPARPTPLDPEEALHELQVHQAELELQNQELRETQTALERARDRYFNLFDLAPIAYFVFDQGHRIAELNLAGAELLEAERGRLKGAPFFPHVAPEYRGQFHDHLNDTLATRRRQTVELRLKQNSDSARHVQLESLIIPGEAGAAPLCLTACMDLTGRRRAEEALRENELRFRQLASVTDQSFWITSIDPEEVLYVNPAFETMWGIPAKELHRNPRAWIEATLPEDRPKVESALDNLLRDARPETGDLEYRIRRPDGSVRWLLDSFRLIRDAQGRAIRLCGIARDITERKQAEEKRLDFERKLLETQKLESLGVMAGGIAHDFNNLLTGILGNAGLAKMKLDPASPTYRSLERIEVASQRAAELCKQMLAYSGRGRFVVEPLNLNLVIQETMHLMRFSITKNATLAQDLAPSLPPVLADATQMRQVLMNLVINASEAMGNGPGTIHIVTECIHATHAQLKESHLSPDLPDGDYVALEVRDTGCGMTPETLACIFDPFFTTKFTGRGLGLAAVLGIVRGHRGGIKVNSEPGRGSTFRILLPRAEAPSSEPGLPACTDHQPTLSGTVLLVDDEEVVRDLTQTALRAFGLEVLVATDGREGLTLFQAHARRIGCVLLDLTMPQMSGEQAFEAMRRVRADAPIVLMSGYSEQEAVNRFDGKHLSGFLQKPFTPDSLYQSLKSFLSVAGPAPRT